MPQRAREGVLLPGYRRYAFAALIALVLVNIADAALAHAIGGKDAAFVAATRGPAPVPFAYLGGKHMVTGYDHLLFLFGVIFFLRRLRDVAIYVTLFSLGHSITLLTGVLVGFGLNPFLVDAVIGLSVAYKAFDNLGGFERVFGHRPDPRWIVFAFGLVHGLGLATKLEALRLNANGLLVNLVSFNVGVEIGQGIALSIVLAMIAVARRSRWFTSSAIAANWLIMTAGFCLVGFQIAGYVFTKGA